MDRNSAKKIIHFLEDHLEEQVTLLKRLVFLESPSTDPASQHPVLALLSGFLEELDYQTLMLRGRVG